MCYLFYFCRLVEKPPAILQAPEVHNNLEKPETNTETSSNHSVISHKTTTPPVTESTNDNSNSTTKPAKSVRTIKSALNTKTSSNKHQNVQSRASTAKPKKHVSPIAAPINKDREQGGDYLIEICGRYLNIYGQNAVRFIDKSWNQTKASDVTTVKFNYTSFNGITGMWGKLKQKFPNADNFVFKETNIYCLGQLNALAEIQGLTSLFIDAEGNPIAEKKWESYAIYRLSHWGLRIVNGREVSGMFM